MWKSKMEGGGQYCTDPSGQEILYLRLLQGHSGCEGEGDVVGVVAPLGGVSQVIFHGVQVVEVDVQVRVHQEGEKEKDGEVQMEVEREVEENQGRRHMYDMA